MPATPRPTPLQWDNETLSRFWGYHSQFPENYFSYQKGRDVVGYVSSGLPTGATVLDYGCGPGHLLPHLLDAGFVVQGADISLETMGSAVELGSRQNFLGFATIDDLVKGARRFDAVFLLEVVEHLDDRWLDLTLKQARELLKENGQLIVTTPNEEVLEDSVVYCPVSNVVFHRWQHVRSWSSASLSECLSAHGFREVKTEARTFSQPRSPDVSMLRYRVSGLLNRFRKPQSLISIARK
ncbi:Generic methyltransferase [Rhodopseudomonas palustris HaA2]|uniref:Generic methyltransferase n=1 Tax=Rhodopseudomonas palustris (strain HaA2) TaxID=316058 RepID=Q2IZW2_RHOP2|nr:class I SAM-dependent methyltransferase [Rhodopseudomonas palustris]ABD06248.1 Generic methyltransferase [Rhodopseudomonas palustris HaA2]